MRGRYYVIDNRIKKSNDDFKVNRQTAAVIYLRTPNNNIAVKEGQEDGKRAIISLSIISAFFLFFTFIVMVINNNV
ncbi:hypothetical protein Desor_1671 [Desulfosporosinus orientis DSM 765]|uniref:Uncharacterized protein n=1 Tax=Desulfosporosinus orientis (strain ATCC 19365 / DSM 765 / NCIMB 8382 / VKM B-1628 / Singapore I) TaxID=768706 RepID=G7WEY2_DESOD|nr:hypothetical protein [Desulfosporosinus orientis]AET67311.1 hypothetical protein Desor_1671 [Desulfosporosinus orientis DSM 765]